MLWEDHSVLLISLLQRFRYLVITVRLSCCPPGHVQGVLSFHCLDQETGALSIRQVGLPVKDGGEKLPEIMPVERAARECGQLDLKAGMVFLWSWGGVQRKEIMLVLLQR